ncbi:MAG TPA: lactate utilization protein B [Candidatus Eremiobacteraceae bacterium]|nr:lactate utilization protein B [Candidatus Eremiobacteraceae bacterium]
MTIHFDRKQVHDDLHRPNAPPVLESTMRRAVEHKHEAQSQIAWEELRERAHAIKKFSIEHLDDMLVRFEREFIARGGQVLWAQTADEAASRFLDICRKHGAKSVVKGKSMVSEELELNARLTAAGIEPVETDLGEYIVQLAGERPSHIIAPAIHMSRQDVGSLFERKLKIEYTDDPETLSEIARLRLRRRYLEAGVGMTGANFGVAETGTVVVVENEGNGGLSSQAPPVQIVIMGIEKVIPTLDDLALFLQLLARSGTGQKMTTYVHHFLGPVAGRTAYCIFVDAGRTELLADPVARESLYCIRCGACLNVCPIYRRVGGDAYGWVYPGPIGSVITPSMVGIDDAGELPFASTLCGACAEECPVKIDLPHMLVHQRAKAVDEGAASSPIENALVSSWARAMSSVRGYSYAVGAARIANAASSILPWISSSARAWSKERSIPKVASTTFKDWWSER